MTGITPEMIRAAQEHDLATRPAHGSWGAVPSDQVSRLLAGALPELLAERDDLRERADFYEAERDRHRLGEEHHRTAYVELQEELTEARADLAAEQERIRGEAEALKFTIFHPGGGSQSLDVVPLGALLALLGPQPDGDATNGTGEGEGAAGGG